MEWTTLASLSFLSVAFASDDTVERFPIGYWYGPPVEHTSEKTYAEIAAAHFNLALPQGTGPHLPEQNVGMLDVAASNRIRCIVADDRLSPDLLKQPDGLAILDKIVSTYESHPAFWGYFIKDEPSSKVFDDLADLLDALADRDPDHPGFINLFPNYATPVQLGIRGYEEYVERYMQVVQPEILSYDHYHFLKNGDRPGFFENLRLIREKAEKYAVPFWAILLCVTHGPYRDLTEAELRWEVFHSLAYGAQGILYFTYWTPPSDKKWHWRNGIISWDGQQTAHYAHVQRINAVIETLGPTLMSLLSTGIYHSGRVPENAEELSEGTAIYRAQGGDLTFGFFEDSEEQEWVLVVNSNYRKEVRATLSIVETVDQVDELDKNTGRMRPLPIGNTGDEPVLQLMLAPVDGRLLRIGNAVPVDVKEIPVRRRF